jgi:TRAP-type C4-dicarboxylate transport system substrate-binding protein
MYLIKVFEIAKFCTETNHSFTNGFVFMGKKAWNSLSEQDRAIFIEGGKEDTVLARKLAVERHRATLDLVQDKLGVTVVKIDTKPLQKAVSPIYEKYAKAIEGGPALIQQMIDTP